MTQTQVKVQRLKPEARLPHFAHHDDAAADLHICEAFTLRPGQCASIDMGFAIELPPGHAGYIMGRSGLAAQGILVHPGLIDPSYRRAVHVMLVHHGAAPVAFAAGDRIAQLQVRPFPAVSYVEGQVEPTGRGGLGSTGLAPMGMTWGEATHHG